MQWRSLAAFFLACLVPAIVLSLVCFIPNEHINYSKRIEIYVNGSTADVVTAAWGVGRHNEVLIQVGKQPLFQSPLLNYLCLSFILTVVFVAISSVIHFIYARINKRLQRKEE
jgi:ABC-type glycerol-3-phosphate transport system permease component